ncbi:prophage Lp2 protein 4 [Streptococcus anginosus]|uniref:Prophage Lp2 protein 4 n=1 Tax=Streptococcus anginosus TaxID=1328 RepID=A0A4U9Z830_STRAP|nr:AAA family ATPase [Streptococcus anginosus]VTS36493.1 prophage Lp2 protein 4 [Streptococcus anginosus]VTS50415.1 prophage Lp2 protein 4 [Streptococcus anginosus]
MEKIKFIQYRKLKNLTLEFDEHINIIAGTNGTCKSSILHLVSNSHQRVSSSSKQPILSTIQKINKIFNPKIEALARGDKKYNDPAPGITGTLYTAYYEKYSLDFRRHNSKTIHNTSRFAIKPKYLKGTTDRLPELPIIYLGMFRLFSYGEWEGESKFQNIINKLPQEYLNELSNLYKKFTGYEVRFDGKLNNFGGIRSKTEFSTQTEGIDSNTISAGEDNLLTILMSLVSLKAYYENITIDTEDDVKSILLIDELDASLHPEFQIKLLQEFKNFSENYHIQIFLTTHSFSLIDYSLDEKIGNIIYLTDQIDHVDLLNNVNKYSINALLQNKLVSKIYANQPIPVLLEDDEAKDFFNNLLQAYYEKYNLQIKNFFHVIDAKLSSSSIIALATDRFTNQSTLRMIAITDGDQQLGTTYLTHNLFSLPGNLSPEELVFNYLRDVLMDEIDFWKKQEITDAGYTKRYVTEHFITQLDNLKQQLNKPGSHHGEKREGNKKIYKNDKDFWNYVMKYWIDTPSNQVEVEKFFENLQITFHKAAPFYNQNPTSSWPFKTGQN